MPKIIMEPARPVHECKNDPETNATTTAVLGCSLHWSNFASIFWLFFGTFCVVMGMGVALWPRWKAQDQRVHDMVTKIHTSGVHCEFLLCHRHGIMYS